MTTPILRVTKFYPPAVFFIMDSRQRRQEIYDRIRNSSREEVILREMQRLGFWPKGEEKPSLAEELIQEEVELSRELRELLAKQRLYKDQEELLEAIRKERLANSRAKQKENQEKKEQEKAARAAAWVAIKERDVIYLGEGVSAGLSTEESEKAKLAAKGVPVFKTVEGLAEAMGITVGKLRFLAYNRKVSKTSHYKRFYIAKKRGGKRLISAPMPDLKKAQHWILKHILDPTQLHDAAHGFRHGRSIVSNAFPHLKQDLVINLDLKDFFPSIHYKRVKGVFRGMGYSEKIATVLALITTEPEADQVEVDGQTYWVAKSDRMLPQGAPTSPAITNIICRRMDARLLGIAKKLGFTYTRYADDLTFSGTGESGRNISRLLAMTKKVVREEDFRIHPDKMRIMRQGSRKEVTGVVVNEKPGISRKKLKKFKALIFQIEKDGIKGKSWDGSSNLLASIRGYAQFICMVDPEKGRPLAERVDKILKQHKFRHEIKHPAKPKITAQSGTNETAKKRKKPWWKFW